MFMFKYVVQGDSKIYGTVNISGSKNASLPLLVASILTDDDIILHNIPELLDVQVLIKILEPLGKRVSLKNGNALVISRNGKQSEAPYKLVKKLRGSIIVLGPLLAKRKKCRVSYPGGCAFGPRPIDLHLEGMRNLGATINLDSGYIDASCEELLGTTMRLSGKHGPTVLGTDNVLMAATLAKGTTVIKDAAMEPECSDLANMLVQMGAHIEGIGTNTLTIHGVEKLHGTEYTVIPDRIEAGTYLAMAAASRGKLTVKNLCVNHIEEVLELLKNIGCDIKINSESEVIIDATKNKLKPFNTNTLPYPKFPTDLQSIFTALACTIDGVSKIKESVFPDRFTHILELQRMGADIELDETHTIIINGGKKLSGADVQASDLRAGVALVLAGICAKGETNVHRIYHIERGYSDIVEKLNNIQAKIKKEEDDIL